MSACQLAARYSCIQLYDNHTGPQISPDALLLSQDTSSTPVDHRSTDRAVSTKWPVDLCQSIHNSYFHAMRAQNHMCIFSLIHQNIDPKSTENPDICREARMHDFGIFICCFQNLLFVLTACTAGHVLYASAQPLKIAP